jgi:hypothetical protein
MPQSPSPLPGGADNPSAKEADSWDETQASNDRRAWIGNLCVAGVLTGACIAFGCQFLDWWGRAAYSPEERYRDVDLSGDHQVTAPSLPTMEAPFVYERLAVWGERPLLGETMRRLCRSKAEVVLPELSASQAMLPPAGLAEIRLLKVMANSSAIETRPGEWIMYEHAGPIPLIVVVGLPADAPLSSATDELRGPYENTFEDSQSQQLPRVICWAVGLAGGDNEPGRFAGPLPPAPELWSVLLCSRDAFNPPMMGITMLPDLPSDIHRSMTLSLRGNGCLVSVKGVGGVKQWIRRFDDWNREREGSRMSPWEEVSGVWHVRYIEPTRQVDVNLIADGDDSVAGMVSLVMRSYGGM